MIPLADDSMFGSWMEWAGGDCPMPEYQTPEVRYRSGGKTEMQANRFRWKHTGQWDDVMAYRFRILEQL